MSHNHCPTITLSNSLTLSHYHTITHLSHHHTVPVAIPEHIVWPSHCHTIHPLTPSHCYCHCPTITLSHKFPSYSIQTCRPTRICSETRAFLCKLKFTCLLQPAQAGLNLWVGPMDLACIILQLCWCFYEILQVCICALRSQLEWLWGW